MKRSAPIACPSSRPPAGFTIIELLVVISIIALLIGLLLPALGRARDSAKAVKCLSNMRSLGQAITLYHADERLTFPQPAQETTALGAVAAGESLWFNAIDYYLQQTSRNYSSSNTAERNYEQFKQDPVWLDLPDDAAGSTPDQRNMQTIKMNAFFGHTNLSTPTGGAAVAWFRLTKVPNPASTVLFVDGRAHDTPSETSGNVDGNEFHANPTFVGVRHNDGANLASADGAARYEQNQTDVSSSGYRGWFNEIASNDTALWPETVFNFRP